jgi:hypothetical protein
MDLQRWKIAPGCRSAFYFRRRFCVPNGASLVIVRSYIHLITLWFSSVLKGSLGLCHYLSRTPGQNRGLCKIWCEKPWGAWLSVRDLAVGSAWRTGGGCHRSAGTPAHLCRRAQPQVRRVRRTCGTRAVAPARNRATNSPLFEIHFSLDVPACPAVAAFGRRRDQSMLPRTSP